MAGGSPRKAAEKWARSAGAKACNYGEAVPIMDYEELREQYVEDRIDLAEFATAVVAILLAER